MATAVPTTRPAVAATTAAASDRLAELSPALAGARGEGLMAGSPAVALRRPGTLLSGAPRQRRTVRCAAFGGRGANRAPRRAARDGGPVRSGRGRGTISVVMDMRTSSTATASQRMIGMIWRLCRYASGESANPAATNRSRYRCRRFDSSLAAASGPLLMSERAPMTTPPTIRTTAGRPLRWMPTPTRAAARAYSASWCPPKGTWRRDETAGAIV